MLKTLLVISFLAFTFHAGAQNGNTKYDKKLADSLGADQYGMKSYVLVILKTGRNSAVKPVADSLLRRHLANMVRMANEGKLVVAGPMQANDKQYEGIFILNVTKVEDARMLLQTDPAIKAGLLDTELYGWYGSAALPKYLPYHDRIQASKMF